MCDETVKIEETVEAAEVVAEAVETVEIEPLFEEHVDFETFSKMAAKNSIALMMEYLNNCN